jgi:tryptophanyl-tRNA synthetase
MSVNVNVSATHVPVGDDQTQHLETTRTIARQFNMTFPSSATPIFNIPETIFGYRPEIFSD